MAFDYKLFEKEMMRKLRQPKPFQPRPELLQRLRQAAENRRGRGRPLPRLPIGRLPRV